VPFWWQQKQATEPPWEGRGAGEGRGGGKGFLISILLHNQADEDLCHRCFQVVLSVNIPKIRGETGDETQVTGLETSCEKGRAPLMVSGVSLEGTKVTSREEPPRSSAPTVLSPWLAAATVSPPCKGLPPPAFRRRNDHNFPFTGTIRPFHRYYQTLAASRDARGALAA